MAEVDAELIRRQAASKGRPLGPVRAAELAAEVGRLEALVGAERDAGPELLADPAAFVAALARGRDLWPPDEAT
jgi:hypothetical protein